MNRVIKFRGKRLIDGKWIYGVPYLDGGWHIMIDSNTATPEEGTGSWSVDPATVGQFTGLIDKNGKEIFEGDVIKTRFGHVKFIRFWYGSFVTFRIDDGLVMEIHDKDEVIGNIHDNPELIKTKTKNNHHE